MHSVILVREKRKGMIMLDKWQREINYIRISITDRCNFNCSYCNPQNNQHLNHKDILSYEEIIKIANCLIKIGIVNFKITGGEPTLRKDYQFLIKELKKIEGVNTVTLTTNGSLFSYEDLDELKRIGIDGINFSIDTLNKVEYQQICQNDALDKVLDNLLYANKIGIKVKVNCVVNEEFKINRVNELLKLIKDNDIALRFIEVMPLKYSLRSNKISLLNKYLIEKYKLSECCIKLGNGPAQYYQIAGYRGYIGFIEALHHKFCYQCNRIRLSSTGDLKLCLFHNDMINIRDYIDDEEKLTEVLKKAIYNKPKEHNFEDENSETLMNQIGG